MIKVTINNVYLDLSKELGIRINKALKLSSTPTFSYSFDLPKSNTNNKIFKNQNIEEVAHDFGIEYTCQIEANDETIFDGKLIINEINKESYNCSVYLGKNEGLKDIFGDRKMNKPSADEEKNEWTLPVTVNPRTFINQNTIDLLNGQKKDAAFPYVLYGLIPKVPLGNTGQGDLLAQYSQKNVFDKWSRIKYEDFPPLVNATAAIKKIFTLNGYNIEGNIFNNEQLSNLYMTYSNPKDYKQNWNWNELGKIRIAQKYQSLTISPVYTDFYKMDIDIDYPHLPYCEAMIHSLSTESLDPFLKFEWKMLMPPYDKWYINLFNTTNLDGKFPMNKRAYLPEIFNDPSGLVIQTENKVKARLTNNWVNNEEIELDCTTTTLTIEHDGWYKIKMDLSNFYVLNYTRKDSNNNPIPTDYTGFHDLNKGFNDDLFMGETYTNQDVWLNGLREGIYSRKYELLLLRDFGMADGGNDTNLFGLNDFLGSYYFKNYDQKPIFEPQNHYTWEDGSQIFLMPKDGVTMVVDPYLCENLVCGFTFGYEFFYLQDEDGDWITDVTYNKKGHPLVLQNGFANNITITDFFQREKIYAAYNSGTTDDDTDIFNMDVQNLILYNGKVYDDIRYDSVRRYGFVQGLPVNNTEVKSNSMLDYNPFIQKREGHVETVMYLHKGEHLLPFLIGNKGSVRINEYQSNKIVPVHVEYSIDIEPYRDDEDPTNWGNFHDNGDYDYNNILDVTQPSTFRKDSINLFDFLPSQVSCFDFVTNFCNAFGANCYKDHRKINSWRIDIFTDVVKNIIDLDGKLNIVDRINQLDNVKNEFYNFQVKETEEGYASKHPDSIVDFGYKFNIDKDSELQPKNTIFSYDWYKKIAFLPNGEIKNGDKYIYNDEYPNQTMTPVPIISDMKVWQFGDGIASYDYYKEQQEWYVDYPIRFFYPDTGSLDFPRIGQNSAAGQISLNKCRNDLNGFNLSYNTSKNQNDIYNKYFNYLIGEYNSVTVVECYLTPSEYNSITNLTVLRYNGDYYRILLVENYDPNGKEKTTIKLIQMKQ